MTCAVVENANGKLTHHTSVINGDVSQTRNTVCVKLNLSDLSEEIINSGVAIKLVSDDWQDSNNPLIVNY